MKKSKSNNNILMILVVVVVLAIVIYIANTFFMNQKYQSISQCDPMKEWCNTCEPMGNCVGDTFFCGNCINCATDPTCRCQKGVCMQKGGKRPHFCNNTCPQ